MPVHYVDTSLVFSEASEEEVNSQASYVCSLSCKAFDIIRGHFPLQSLQGQLTPVCLERLGVFAQILSSAPIGVLKQPDASLSYPPVVPTKVELYVLNACTMEALVFLVVMGQSYQANLRLELWGTRWLCTLLDLG
ncbi:hypothetical protein KIMH_07350 [Bombiscardovia apis]|uniref:Uncharacterized protein n=1 Tax=Bombiscardovia apis TaxID=2932182 RepID=A0ABM8BCH9_9BIFI|nr:hypothetical protein KIMH_07350 [Bombiscardovia apis]